ncbi:hypothetical protein J1605_022083 [Eschrichtius robustus]|uniref:LIM zinc-binding domain-containing protein n=1 Tax=Eschrichtius robustus TaxID=9764 RepID=A0AB34HCQ6_ESCRO|nr:hypothetical protein J1605_022083 [Eschrichtius robustus]
MPFMTPASVSLFSNAGFLVYKPPEAVVQFVCGCDLAQGGFFIKNGEYLCTLDYQRMYGTRCHGCGEFVEGEVVTALGKTYHPNCFACTICKVTKEEETRSGWKALAQVNSESLPDLGPERSLLQVGARFHPETESRSMGETAFANSVHSRCLPARKKPPALAIDAMNTPTHIHPNASSSPLPPLYSMAIVPTSIGTPKIRLLREFGIDIVAKDSLQEDKSKTESRNLVSSPIGCYQGKGNHVERPTDCAGCGRDIKNGQALLALEKQWHLGCFKCKSCGKVLTGEYISKDGAPYCEKDYQGLFGVRCEACHQFITGKVLEAEPKPVKFRCDCLAPGSVVPAFSAAAPPASASGLSRAPPGPGPPVDMRPEARESLPGFS